MTPSKDALEAKRRQAKIGMSVALGTLVGTGFMAHMDGGGKTNLARLLHVAAGVSLVGFSYWHWTLYQKGGMHRGRRA